MIRNIHYSKDFLPNLLDGTKIHTIRKWQCEKGTTLQHVIDPYKPSRRTIMTNTCLSVQNILIVPTYRFLMILRPAMKGDLGILNEEQIEELAKNDGFESVEAFWKYFEKTCRNNQYEFHIIHWTDKEYKPNPNV